jgi:hypothetical protein
MSRGTGLAHSAISPESRPAQRREWGVARIPADPIPRADRAHARLDIAGCLC